MAEQSHYYLEASSLYVRRFTLAKSSSYKSPLQQMRI